MQLGYSSHSHESGNPVAPAALAAKSGFPPTRE
jgi:hypothetical protein